MQLKEAWVIPYMCRGVLFCHSHTGTIPGVRLSVRVRPVRDSRHILWRLSWPQNILSEAKPGEFTI